MLRLLVCRRMSFWISPGGPSCDAWPRRNLLSPDRLDVVICTGIGSAEPSLFAPFVRRRFAERTCRRLCYEQAGDVGRKEMCKKESGDEAVHETILDGVMRQFGVVLQLHFFENPCPIGIDGADAHAQIIRDIFQALS